MRRFANGWFACLAVVTAMFVTPAWVQADFLLKLDCGATGQVVAEGWDEFSSDSGIASVEHTYGAVTVNFTSEGGDLEARNRAAVTFSDPPGDVLRENIGSNDTDLTVKISGLPAGTYNLTSYHHDVLYGNDGRIIGTVTVTDAVDTSVRATDVTRTAGTEAPFSYRTIDPSLGGTLLFQDTPSTASFGITSNGIDPITIVYDGGIYQQKSTSPQISGIVIATAVPEPSIAVLLLSGLVGLLAYAWRKRK
jgi:hypothetical protein